MKNKKKKKQIKFTFRPITEFKQWENFIELADKKNISINCLLNRAVENYNNSNF